MNRLYRVSTEDASCLSCKPDRLRDRAQSLTAEALREFCTGKLAHYKVPRYVHVVEEFPMTVTGKIRKVQMREEAVDILGVHGAAGTHHA